MTKDQLVARIRELAVLHGDFTLRSGRKSKYYVDKYRFETQPDALAALGAAIAAHAGDADRIAGPELGAVALAASASMASGKPCVFIRNSKKDYGTAKQIEGVLEAGEKVLLVEDVLTTGGQAIEAIEMLRDMGCEVTKLVAVIDRQEGARKNVEQLGVEMVGLVTKADLGIDE
ncbi:MAG: orotate phosphoribosyltransferase [Planctomycetota bacterium]